MFQPKKSEPNSVLGTIITNCSNFNCIFLVNPPILNWLLIQWRNTVITDTWFLCYTLWRVVLQKNCSYKLIFINRTSLDFLFDCWYQCIIIKHAFFSSINLWVNVAYQARNNILFILYAFSRTAYLYLNINVINFYFELSFYMFVNMVYFN